AGHVRPEPIDEPPTLGGREPADLPDGLQRAGALPAGGGLERPEDRHLVVPWNGQGAPLGDHPHGDAHGPDDTRPAIDQVAEEHRAPPRGMAERLARRGPAVAEPVQQAHELGGAAVHVSDDVERAGVAGELQRAGGLGRLERTPGHDASFLEYGTSTRGSPRWPGRPARRWAGRPPRDWERTARRNPAPPPAGPGRRGTRTRGRR